MMQNSRNVTAEMSKFRSMKGFTENSKRMIIDQDDKAVFLLNILAAFQSGEFTQYYDPVLEVFNLVVTEITIHLGSYEEKGKKRGDETKTETKT